MSKQILKNDLLYNIMLSYLISFLFSWGRVRSQNLLSPLLATLSSNRARNGGLSVIVPLGQVHALLNRGLRTGRFHGKQRGDIHAVFHSMCSFFSLQLGNPTFSRFLHPPPVFLCPREFRTKICYSLSLQMLLGCSHCCVWSLWSIQ